ncbi:hypothetical protein [Actinoalloteichus fjordicus]|nr:hypothetical protein [Actinoalloteichus fjordicus]
MPSDLAVQVDAFLTVRLMRAPILRADGHPECTLLTGPPTPLRPSTQEELIRLGVRLVPPGTPLTLPAAQIRTGEPRWWGDTALKGSLPPQSIVIAACRSIADSSKEW